MTTDLTTLERKGIDSGMSLEEIMEIRAIGANARRKALLE